MSESRSRACRDKHRFETEGEANQERQRLILMVRLAEVDLIKVYFCKYCHYWHVGHIPGSSKYLKMKG